MRLSGLARAAGKQRQQSVEGGRSGHINLSPDSTHSAMTSLSSHVRPHRPNSKGGVDSVGTRAATRAAANGPSADTGSTSLLTKEQMAETALENNDLRENRV